jgi:hypothetical protein
VALLHALAELRRAGGSGVDLLNGSDALAEARAWRQRLSGMAGSDACLLSLSDGALDLGLLIPALEFWKAPGRRWRALCAARQGLPRRAQRRSLLGSERRLAGLLRHEDLSMYISRCGELKVC